MQPLNQLIKDYMITRVGLPYETGSGLGNGPSAYDCSGLLWSTLRHFGMPNLPDSSAQDFRIITTNFTVGEWLEDTHLAFAYLVRRSDNVATHVAVRLIGDVWISALDVPGMSGVHVHKLSQAYSGDLYKWEIHYVNLFNMMLRYW